MLLLTRERQDGWRVSFEGVDLGVLRCERVRWRGKESRRILTARAVGMLVLKFKETPA